MSLISADDTIALGAALFALAAAGFAVERTAFGRHVSGVVVVLASALALSNLGVLPKAARAYDLVWDYLVPLAIPLLLFNANLVVIIRESGRTLLAFAAASAATLAGIYVGVTLVPLGSWRDEIAGVFSATYIGGSVNFAAVSQILSFSDPELLTASVAADNLAGTIYLIVLTTLPSIALLRRWYGEETNAATIGAVKVPVFSLAPDRLLAALALSAAVVAVSGSLAGLIDHPEFTLLFVTAITVALATTLPRAIARLTGGYELGTAAMYIFFGTIGAGADLTALMGDAPEVLAFAAVILVVHLAVVLGLGRLLRVGLPEILVGSNAAVMGPATASALAGAKGWHHLVTPGILCGVLGYAIANFIGVFVARSLS